MMTADRLNGLLYISYNINQDIEIPADKTFYKTFTFNKFEFFKLIF